MNILVSCDDKYAMPTMVMLTSFFNSNSCTEENSHTVYLMESGLSDEMNSKLQTHVEGFGASYSRVHVSSDVFENAKTASHITKETYYRLLADKLLPGISRVLWLDSDLIVRGDISELYDIELGGNIAACCGYGPAMLPVMTENAARIGMKQPENYFNAGVILLDLNAWREKISDDMLSQAIDPAKIGTYSFADQDILNLLLEGMVKILDYRKFNCMIHCLESKEDLAYAKDNALIVHFPGEAKPWSFNDIHFSDEWLTWYKKCFGETADIKRVSYFRLKALYERQKKLQNGIQ